MKTISEGVEPTSAVSHEGVIDESSKLAEFGNWSVKAFDKAEAWASKSWDKLKTVSSEWMHDVADTIKLKTVDKWNFVRQQNNENTLIAHKQQDIGKLQMDAQDHRTKMTTAEALRDKESARFTTQLESIADPDLKKLFEEGQKTGLSRVEGEISSSQKAIEDSALKETKYKGEIDTFHKNIESAGNAFTTRIDGRINKIHERHGYEEKVKAIGVLTEEIEKGEKDIGESNLKIEEWKKTLESVEGSEVFPKEMKEKIKEGIASMEKNNKEIGARLDRTRKGQTKLQGRIAKIDAKTAKWAKLKNELGLGKKEQPTAAERGNEGQQQEDDASKGTISSEFADADTDAERGVETGEGAEAGPESKEANTEKLTKTFGELYKAISNEKISAEEVLDRTKFADKILKQHEDLFVDEDEKKALFDGMKKVLELYNEKSVKSADVNTTATFKKDVLNKVIRKIPSWIEIKI